MKLESTFTSVVSSKHTRSSFKTFIWLNSAFSNIVKSFLTSLNDSPSHSSLSLELSFLCFNELYTDSLMGEMGGFMFEAIELVDRCWGTGRKLPWSLL